MRVFKLKRETLEGQFSLDHWQLYVGELSDKSDKRYKGMSVLGAFGLHEYPFKVSKEEAKRLTDVIDKVLNNYLPQNY